MGRVGVFAFGLNAPHGAGRSSTEAETMHNDPSNHAVNDEWLDFKAIKAQAEVRPVLQHFGILEHLEQRGAELVGWCPLGREHGKADSFAFNTEKRSFQCFACKARGSVLDFVAKYQGITLRAAAQRLMTILGETLETTGARRETAKPGRPYGKSSASPAPTDPHEASIQPEATHLLLLTWSHAQWLMAAGQLNPDQVAVIDLEAWVGLLRNGQRANSA